MIRVFKYLEEIISKIDRLQEKLEKVYDAVVLLVGQRPKQEEQKPVKEAQGITTEYKTRVSKRGRDTILFEAFKEGFGFAKTISSTLPKQREYDLKLCPFCEGQPRLLQWKHLSGWYVECPICKAESAKCFYESPEESRQAAREVWNRRAL